MLNLAPPEEAPVTRLDPLQWVVTGCAGLVIIRCADVRVFILLRSLCLR